MITCIACAFLIVVCFGAFVGLTSVDKVSKVP